MLWVDTETTGLEPDARILEVGLKLTDLNGKTIGIEDLDIVPHLDNLPLNSSEWALRTHLQNGLLDEGIKSTISRKTMVSDIQDWLKKIPGDSTVYIAGTNPQFDLTRIDALLAAEKVPTLTAIASHRRIDITGVRMLLKSVGFDPYDGSHNGTHRVLDHIGRDVKDWKKYQNIVKQSKELKPAKPNGKKK